MADTKTKVRKTPKRAITATRKADQELADRYENRLQEAAQAQFQRLKDEARAVYGMVDGRPGVRSPAEWQKLLERAGDEIGNGRFIVGALGAERYLDARTVAVLITLRQSLIAELQRPSTADIMRIDAAILAYYNMIRIQGWIGNFALVLERELFGQAPLNELQGDIIGPKLAADLARLREDMLPLIDRANRMMLRNLDGLRKGVARG